MTTRKIAAAALAAAAFLAACGKGGAHASAADTADDGSTGDDRVQLPRGPDGRIIGWRGTENAQDGTRMPRSRPRPARPARGPEPAGPLPYFLPVEWAGQIRAGNLAVDVLYLQAVAIYTYQHRDWALQDNTLDWMAGLFSCADGPRMSNEIDRPAALQRARAAMTRFLDAPPPLQGQIPDSERLGVYDAQSQSFNWDDLHNNSLDRKGVPTVTLPRVKIGSYGGDVYSCRPAPDASVFSSHMAPTDIYMTINGGTIGAIPVPVAQARPVIDRAAQGMRIADLVVRFTIPAAQGRPMSVGGYGIGTDGSIVVNYKGATVSGDHKEFSVNVGG